MALTYDLVRERFKLFAGMDTGEAEQWEPLCRAAMEETLARLRPGTDPELPENSVRLASAAAASAYYRYCLLRTGEELHSLKLGEITLTAPDSPVQLDRGIRLREEYWAAVEDLVASSRFRFGRVAAR